MTPREQIEAGQAERDAARAELLKRDLKAFGAAFAERTPQDQAALREKLAQHSSPFGETATPPPAETKAAEARATETGNASTPEVSRPTTGSYDQATVADGSETSESADLGAQIMRQYIEHTSTDIDDLPPGWLETGNAGDSSDQTTDRGAFDDQSQQLVMRQVHQQDGSTRFELTTPDGQPFAPDPYSLEAGPDNRYEPDATRALEEPAAQETRENKIGSVVDRGVSLLTRRMDDVAGETSKTAVQAVDVWTSNRPTAQPDGAAGAPQARQPVVYVAEQRMQPELVKRDSHAVGEGASPVSSAAVILTVVLAGGKAVYDYHHNRSKHDDEGAPDGRNG